MSKFEFVWECELAPKFDCRASFYKKAIVKLFNNNGEECYKLYSYGSLVMVIDGGKLYRMKNIDLYSYTTMRHCREFVQQFYKEKWISKKDLLNLPNVWKE